MKTNAGYSGLFIGIKPCKVSKSQLREVLPNDILNIHWCVVPCYIHIFHTTFSVQKVPLPAFGSLSGIFVNPNKSELFLRSRSNNTTIIILWKRWNLVTTADYQRHHRTVVREIGEMFSA